MINITIKIFRLHCGIFSCILVCLLLSSNAIAQVNIEAAARLYFSIEDKPNKWIEGYQSYISGSFSPYQSHRSGNNRDSAFVARTSGGESSVEWNTAPVPQKWRGDSASFIWVCGFGNNLGNQWYDLKINGKNSISFSTKNDAYWSISGKDGERLSFTAVYKNSNGANFGYMALTVPNALLEKGKALKLCISGRLADKETWYRLFPYRDAIQYALKNEKRNIYTNIEFVHMGDAELTLCAAEKLSDLPVKVYHLNNTIAEARLHQVGIISKTTIIIPRYLQPGLNENSIIKIAGRNIDTIDWSLINKKRLRAFMEEEIVCSKYVFSPGYFPEFRWKNELIVENELGKLPLKVSFYNSDFQPVISAEKTGSYYAVVEGTTASGFVIKRYITLFCSNAEFDDYSRNIPLRLNWLKDYEITDEKWKQYSENEERFSFGSLKMFPQQDDDAAIFLSGLNELDSLSSKYDTPRIKDRQKWISLKLKLEGKENLLNPLKTPQRIINESSTPLNDSIVSAAGYKKELLEKVRTVCSDWAEKGGAPNVTLVVHKGKIIFHEAFGKDEEGKLLTLDSKMWMASITKLLTGVLIMQFVEQGIIDLDSPVRTYLPELKGNDKLTVRHLLTHISGLQFAGEWASDWNYSLENQVAQLLPSLEVGSVFSYNRVGYALAGKIIERITGQAAPYLFNRNVFIPLAMKSSFTDNTYGGLFCTALDLARLGQMLLNKGTYNGSKLFSEQTFKKMLPEKLPVSDHSWGIGTTPMGGHGLSSSAFAHGAASGTVFRIDPEKDLIIISARNHPGKSHDEFENLLIESCAALVNNK